VEVACSDKNFCICFGSKKGPMVNASSPEAFEEPLLEPSASRPRTHLARHQRPYQQAEIFINLSRFGIVNETSARDCKS
jgi:hypothetical protein